MLSRGSADGSFDAVRERLVRAFVSATAEEIAAIVTVRGWTREAASMAQACANTLLDVFGTGGYAIHRWERWTRA